MKKYHTIIIGGGNMGVGIIQSLIKTQSVPLSRILAVESKSSRRNLIVKKFSIDVQRKIEADVLSHAKFIIIAVKPQDFPSIAPILHAHFPKNGVLISIMAGVRISTLRAATGHKRIIRIMPNLPVTVGEGYSAWISTRNISRSQKLFVKKILSSGGKEIEISDEKMLDAVTAIAGSGPAYVFHFIENLISIAERVGFSKKVSKEMVIQVIRGSLSLIEQFNEQPDSLRAKVTSKGGTTEVAFKIIKKYHLESIWQQAIKAAFSRSKQISQSLDEQLH